MYSVLIKDTLCTIEQGLDVSICMLLKVFFQRSFKSILIKFFNDFGKFINFCLKFKEKKFWKYKKDQKLNYLHKIVFHWWCQDNCFCVGWCQSWECNPQFSDWRQSSCTHTWCYIWQEIKIKDKNSIILKLEFLL